MVYFNNTFTEKIKVGGSHENILKLENLTRDNVTVLDFGNVDIVSLICVGKNYCQTNGTKLKKGQFTVINGKLFVRLFEKVTRPIVYVEYRNRESITVNSVKTLKRRSPARSHLFVKNRVKNKISWGCAPCKIQGIDTTRTIPSKLGKIHFDGTMFILNNRAIAVIEKNTVVPKVDILTKDGEYLYNRVMSIFELSHVKTRYGLLHMENNEIFLNKVSIATIVQGELKPSVQNKKMFEKVKTEVVRMINLDETLDYVSPKKTNIKADLMR